jgi:hypothetical protein
MQGEMVDYLAFVPMSTRFQVVSSSDRQFVCPVVSSSAWEGEGTGPCQLKILSPDCLPARISVPAESDLPFTLPMWLWYFHFALCYRQNIFVLPKVTVVITATKTIPVNILAAFKVTQIYVLA